MTKMCCPIHTENTCEVNLDKVSGSISCGICNVPLIREEFITPTQKPVLPESNIGKLLAWQRIHGPWNKGKVSAAKGVWIKGDKVCYATFHRRVYKVRGKATMCEHCYEEGRVKYEWANISGKYEDINDYKQLCVPCHRRFDSDKRKLKKGIKCK